MIPADKCSDSLRCRGAAVTPEPRLVLPGCVRLHFTGLMEGVLDPDSPREGFSLVVWCLHLSLWAFVLFSCSSTKGDLTFDLCSKGVVGCSGFYLLVVGLTVWSPSFAINNILVQPITNAHADTHMNLGLLLLRFWTVYNMPV